MLEFIGLYGFFRHTEKKSYGRLHMDDSTSEQSRKQRLRNEKIRLLYSHVWQPVFAGILGAFLLAYTLHEIVGETLLWGWLIAILMVYGLRLRIAFCFLIDNVISFTL